MQIILTENTSEDLIVFERLFLQYQPQLVNFLIGLTHDKEVSRDLSQDIFCSLWKNRRKLNEVHCFSSYLFQMARFTVYDYFDHLAVTNKYTTEYLMKTSSSESVEEEIFVTELQSIINLTVEQMSHQQARIYRMSREEGFSNDEIAKCLNISKRTVENHLTAALAILRKVIYLYVLLYIQLFEGNGPN